MGARYIFLAASMKETVSSLLQEIGEGSLQDPVTLLGEDSWKASE